MSDKVHGNNVTFTQTKYWNDYTPEEQKQIKEALPRIQAAVINLSEIMREALIKIINVENIEHVPNDPEIKDFYNETK